MKTKWLWFVLTVTVILGGTVAFAETKPWEDPNSGFNSPNATTQTTGSTGGYDKIDKVITSTGATTNNGKVVSTTGSDKDKGFVDGFLNNAASKITGVNGTASAWSWSKKWKIGPDGKPMEVVETHHEGSLNITGSNNAKPATSGSTPSTGSTGSTPSSSSSGPAIASVPASKPATGPAASPVAASSKPGSSSGPSASSPGASGPAAPAPATPPAKGVNVAPTALPQGIPPNVIMAELGIVDQLSGQEQKFNSTVTPKTTSKPIPEDVRTKFSLDVADTMKDKVKVTVDDPDDPAEFPYQATFHHVFRTPSMDRYKVVVTYPDQTTGVYKPILTVQVPVYKMNFKSTVLEATQNRISDDKELMANQKTSSAAYSGSTTGAGSNGSSSPAENTTEQVDMSDLYTNPENPPDVSGQDLVAGAVPMAPAGTEPGSTGLTDSQKAAGLKGQNQAGSTNGQATVSSNGFAAGSSSGNAVTSSSSGSSASSGSTSGSSSGNAMMRKGSSGKSSLAYVGNEITPDSGSSEGGSSEDTAAAPVENGNTAAGENLSGQNAGNPLNSGSEGRTQLASREGSEGPSATGATAGAVNTADRPYLISLTMKPAGAEVGQSFDFTDTPYPTSHTLNKDSQVTFIFDLSKSVKRDSVQVVLFDGKDKNTQTISALGNDMIDHKFTQPTAEAFVWVYGESDKGPFSYKLSIPVE